TRSKRDWSSDVCSSDLGDYKQTIKNTAELVKKIMKEENISILNVKQHNVWSGKNCPAQIRAGKDGITWGVFIDMIKGDSSTSKRSEERRVGKEGRLRGA